jgi:UDP-N-acetylmuramoyl-L-alanyl-D-glutamate--2,6-diaminopimelate ligase
VDGDLTGNPDTVITDITHDSRHAGDGSIFVAIEGLTTDGHRFIPQVLANGAAGIISERAAPDAFDGVWIRVTNARIGMALAAAEVHGHPSKELNLVGITGTNGKTTTTYLVAAIARSAGEPAAMTTTVEYLIGDTSQKADRTTPEATDMERFLREAVTAGCRTAVMECSSQAMDLHRCDGLRYAVAVFTNLTRDHLDYHGTMENYFAAKKRLFDGRLGEQPGSSVINIDDAGGRELLKELLGRGQKVVTYGLQETAEVTAQDVKHSLDGMKFRLRTPAGERELTSPLVGRPHIYNIMAAVATGLELGYSFDVIVRAIETSSGAPGRFERVAHSGKFAVVVDYAHTDDALLNVLNTARDVAEGRIITVFGCGGDRDTSKRAPMGEAAGSLSDVVILTSDNPRTEDPEKILSDVEVGLRATSKPYEKIADRRTAIHTAIGRARPGDVVIIAGKGHEDYQILGKEIFHFDDKEVAREALGAPA